MERTEDASRRVARIIMEQHLFGNDYKLPKECVVHHIDGNPFNNDISNLQLMSHQEHTNHHCLGKGKYGISFRGNEKEWEKRRNSVPERREANRKRSREWIARKRASNPEVKEAEKKYEHEYYLRKKEEVKIIKQYKEVTNENTGGS